MHSPSLGEHGSEGQTEACHQKPGSSGTDVRKRRCGVKYCNEIPVIHKYETINVYNTIGTFMRLGKKENNVKRN